MMTKKFLNEFPGMIVIKNFFDYTVTDEPIEVKEFDRLPEDIKQTIIETGSELIYKQPDKAIPIIENLMTKITDLPMLYNHLSVAYQNIGNYEKSKEITVECYKKFPDYIMGRCNYAAACLVENKPFMVTVIFNDKYDLQALYPKRKIFHVDEYVAFNRVLCMYFYQIEDIENAKIYYNKLLHHTTDKHKQLIKFLKKVLYPSLFRRICNWLTIKISYILGCTNEELKSYRHTYKIK